METGPEQHEDATLSTIKEMRTRLESRIDAQHAAHLDLLSSVRSTVPNIVPSLDLSLKIISSFTGRPFVPTPPLPEPTPSKHHHQFLKPDTEQTHGSKYPVNNLAGSDPDDSTHGLSGNPISVVRAMVAECLLQRVPFSPTDSSTVLRKLENDENATAAEKSALQELGGEFGPIHAVEVALRSMAEENASIELEEFVVSGKSGVMVLAIDRTRLLKELPESSSLVSDEPDRVETQNAVGTLPGGGVFPMSGPGRPEMWTGGLGDPNLGFRPMMGGGPRGLGIMGMHPMGMMAMGAGRPPLLPQPQAIPSGPRLRTEEEDMKDVEAILSKKSFREKQQSRTGEELLDLIHRPTAKEAATAAKVLNTVISN